MSLNIIGTPQNPLFIVKEICNILELSSPTMVLKNIPEQWKYIDKVKTNGGYRLSNIITLEGLKQIIMNTKSNNICHLLKLLEDNNINLNLNIKYVCKEASFIRLISKTFKHLPQKHQYSVGRYRIDLYFPTQKLAIECDEHGHKTLTYRENDTKRQTYIENKLGCTFIRFNPDKKYFNIGDVINLIILSIKCECKN